MFKEKFAFLIVGLLIAAGGYFWWARGSSFARQAAQRATEEEPKAAQGKSANSKVAVKTKTTNNPNTNSPAARKSAAGEQVSVASSSAAAVTAPEKSEAAEAGQQTARREPLPFPTVDKIATGVREDSITRTYGDPALSALTSTGTHVVETFVYAKDQGRSATVIRLEDGKVSRAYARSEPAPPTGLSAPPRPARKN